MANTLRTGWSREFFPRKSHETDGKELAFQREVGNSKKKC